MTVELVGLTLTPVTEIVEGPAGFEHPTTHNNERRTATVFIPDHLTQIM